MKALRRIGEPALALLACVLVVVLFHLSRGLDYHAIVQHLRDTPSALVWLAGLLTAISYLALVARDLCALSYARVAVPTPVVVIASFSASALGNAVGFGKLTGTAVRSRVYGLLGVSPEQLADIMSFIKVMFGIGLVAFLGVSAMLANGAAVSRLGVSPFAANLTGSAALVAVIGAISIAIRRGITLPIGPRSFSAPTRRLAMTQILATGVDLAAAGASLWILLPTGRLDFFTFSAIFSVATAVAVVSRVPAGLGVFDIVAFCALRNYAAPDRVVAALLLYRGVYFVLPLLLAASSLAVFELRRTAADRGSIALRRIQKGAGLLAPLFLSAITFSVGAMLIMSGATPAVDWRLAVLQSALPLWAVETSHLLATLAGVLLLFVARGLYHRLDGAWWLALIIALANVAFSLAKGLAFGETAAVLLLVFLLLATRQQFARPAAFLRQPFTIGWFFAVAVVIAAATGVLLFAFRDVPYRREIWWQFEFDAQASRSLRAILGASIFALGFSLWQLLRAAPGRIQFPSARDLLRAELIIREQPRTAPMLALMGDKGLLFSASGKSFLMYAKRGRSWIALLDPVGPRAEWPELVRRLVELAHSHGGRAAWYQVLPDSLPVYLDAGLRVVKIGEEAVIHLEQFGLEGPHRYGLRQGLKRAERDGLSFELLDGERTASDLQLLNRISEAWLAARRGSERSFSVAGFEPRFIARQLVGLCRQGDAPIAFVTCMTTDCQSEATLGLMRQRPTAPPYVMEFMITRLAMELRARDFQALSLGMAPLAGLVRTPLSSRWHRIAGMLWEHGEPIYNFQGLRSFKGKFRPVWEPRYLAASGAIGPFINLADVAVLAGGRARRSSAA
ncbi:MAG TPA: bifunctional lysylphosphatidylglycerol flippase/synthetase MprF [Candidatus Binataceae bacterium]|nr:bifunctional lysylphosphatidylglycerol flippase/synthetase MprF [Candidatus Binataceae bacterium]